MPELNFIYLQNQHEYLLQKQQKVMKGEQQSFTKEVRGYIEQAKQAGSIIASTRERDQLRANLRYWANYIYSIEKTFPDTELAPSTVTGGSSFWTSGPGLTTLVFGLVLFIGLGNVLFGLGNALFRDNGTTSTPTETSSGNLVATQVALGTLTPGATIPEATPTTFSPGSNVELLIPENDGSVERLVTFSGAYTNMKAGNSIHMLLVRSDRLYPIKDFVTIPRDSSLGEWELPATLYSMPKELETTESLTVVPGACFDDACREKLAISVEGGVPSSELTSNYSFALYRDSLREIHRIAYQVITETMVVYSLSSGASYDLHLVSPDGSIVRQITATSEYSEISPNLSPDGTKIVYVHKVEATQTYSIHIMDSNGENDVEITPGTKNILENPQWSPDGRYISYAMGDEPSTSRASWFIHVYEIETQRDNILRDEPEDLVQPYHTWLPDSTGIIFEARPQLSGTTGFDMALLGSSDLPTPFFDSNEDDIQPRVKPIENGYLITFTTVRNDKKHDIFGALLYPDRQFPFDGFQIRLTNTRAGEFVRGLESASTNFPIPDPDPNSNSIYYLRNNNIYRLEFNIVDGKIELLEGKISDGERYGDEVIHPPDGQDIFGYDVGYMEAFFPIFIIP